MPARCPSKLKVGADARPEAAADLPELAQVCLTCEHMSGWGRFWVGR